MHPAQGQQYGRAVCTSSAQSGTDRNLFAYVDFQTCKRDKRAIIKYFCRLVGNIAAVGRQKTEIRFDFIAAAVGYFNINLIAKINRLHHHLQIMIAVVSLFDHIEREVYLCVSICRKFFDHSLYFQNFSLDFNMMALGGHTSWQQ
ncbi:hypothetical protein SDC9_144302 [bioreactor metagenome]|uniref:Uncharacterized protein n=1 Tax=bioreactor metagenome TaxID=1076179 RepID=A0A645E6G9_9ZZZZ